MTRREVSSWLICKPPTEGFPPPPRIPTRPGHSPPSVLGGIQLSGLPWSPAGVSSTTFGLAPHGSAVSSRSPPTSRSPHHRMMGRVSFLFWSRPSRVASLDAARPAVREELPQEIPVARPPTRVAGWAAPRPINHFPPNDGIHPIFSGFDFLSQFVWFAPPSIFALRHSLAKVGHRRCRKEETGRSKL
jgi:hypothetical protein